jgi:hypothetical protein
MEPAINSIIKKTYKFKGKIGDLVTSYSQYPNDNKSLLLLAYKSIIAEHHNAIFLLVQNGLNGSAFALVRVLYETFYRAHWAVGCATKEQVDETLEGKEVFPDMSVMVKKIDATFGTEDFFQIIKKDSWRAMNDYTHSGLLQISRRFENNEVSPNYDTGEIVEVLNGINMALILTAILFFRFFAKVDAVKEVEQILYEYSEDKKQTKNT